MTAVFCDIFLITKEKVKIFRNLVLQKQMLKISLLYMIFFSLTIVNEFTYLVKEPKLLNYSHVSQELLMYKMI